MEVSRERAARPHRGFLASEPADQVATDLAVCERRAAAPRSPARELGRMERARCTHSFRLIAKRVQRHAAKEMINDAIPLPRELLPNDAAGRIIQPPGTIRIGSGDALKRAVHRSERRRVGATCEAPSRLCVAAHEHEVGNLDRRDVAIANVSGGLAIAVVSGWAARPRRGHRRVAPIGTTHSRGPSPDWRSCQTRGAAPQVHKARYKLYSTQSSTTPRG
jgi:hypothetical protein